MIARLQLTPIETSALYDWDAEIEQLIAEIHEDDRIGATIVTDADQALYRALTADRPENPKGSWTH